MSDEQKEAKTRAVSDIYSTPANDGMTNVISGLGTSKARNPATFLNRGRLLDRIELEDIYRHYWISKAVDIRPWDMTREGRTFKGSNVTPQQIETLEVEEKRINLWGKVRQSLIWAGTYGGAGIVMHVNGQGEMFEELDVSKVKKGQLSHLSTLDRWELLPSSGINFNPLSKDFGRATYYRVANDTGGNLIHKSRIVFFNGRDMPIRVTRQLWGWGDSLIQRWYSAITNSETLSAAIIEGVHQSNVDVVGTKGLADLLAMDNGEEKAKDRFMLMDYCKSLLNMSIMDSEDTFTRNAFPFSGLPELYNVFLQVLASATDIPVTRLLGSSPGGLNSTGDGDIRNYYDSVASAQTNDLFDKLYKIDQVMVRSALGSYPETLGFDFNSLWQLTETEQATVDSVNAGTLAILQSIGIPELVIIKEAIERGLVKNMTIEEVEALEKEGEVDADEDNDDFIPEPKTTIAEAHAPVSTPEGSIQKSPASATPKIKKVT